MEMLVSYLLIVNVLAFFFMRRDKILARKRSWRIPEAVLLFLAVMGGSLGALLAMNIYRHKTKHNAFTLGVPLMLFVHVALVAIYWLYKLHI